MPFTISFRRIEPGFAVLTLLLSTESFILLIPHALRQVFWLAVYAMTTLLLVLQWRAALPVIMRAKLLWLYMGFVAASVVWSTAPGETVQKAIALTGTTLFGVYLAERYSLKQQLRLLAWVMGIAVILSFVFALGLPSYGLQGGQSWQGIYHHKNLLGRVMVLSGMVFLLNAQQGQRRAWIYWAGLGLSVVLLVFSNSKTALALFVLLLAFMPVYRIVRLYYKLAVPVLSVTLLLCSGVFIGILAQIESVVGAAGKDLTFSGRTDLWSIALTKIQERLWWGYGYGGFWRGWSGPSADVWFLEPWFPKHSHNGYLDLWLDLGLMGMVVFGLGLAFVFYRAIRRVSVTQTSEYLLPLAYLTFMLLYNLTESVWLLQNTFFWIFYVTTVCTRHERLRVDEPEGLPKPPIEGKLPVHLASR